MKNSQDQSRIATRPPFHFALTPILLASLSGMAFAQNFSPEVIAAIPAGFVGAPLLLDLDSDGDRDVTVTSSSGIFTVAGFENFGEGFFAAQRGASLAASVSSFRSDAIAADLDGDGDDDIAFCGGLSTGVGWVENPGTGTFGAAQLISSAITLQIEAGDLNGNGRIDLVVSEQGGRIGWYPNLGNGSFGGRQVLGQNVGNLRGFDVADLDLDGDLDVVYAEISGETVGWIEQTSGGVFAAAAVVLDDMDFPNSPIVADINADGVQDLILGVSGNSGRRRVVLRLGLPAGGYGLPDRLYAIQSGDFAGFSLVDLGGSGGLDLVIASSVEPAVRLPSTGTSFGMPLSLPTQPVTGKVNFGASDLNGDGRIDLVIVESASVQVLWREGSGFSSPAELAADVDIDSFAGPLRQAQNFAADLSGDGIADVVLTEDFRPSGYDVHLGLGNGAITASKQTFEFPDIVQTSAVDLDGDGDLDLVSSGGSFNSGRANAGWSENLGGGTLAEVDGLFSNLANGAASFATGDLEGDGDLDVLVAYPSFFSLDVELRWVEQLGPGSFVDGPTVPTLNSFSNVRLADADMDGVSDAFVTRTVASDGSIIWRRGDGTGQFALEVFVRSASQPSIGDLVLGDVNNDGHADIVVASASGVELYLWDTSTSSYAGPTLLEGPTSSFGVTRVILADLTGDGLVDVLASARQESGRWIENLGGGNFGSAQPLPEDFLGSQILGAADRDGDQDLDIFKVQASGSIAWNVSNRRLGFGECGPAALNSTGEAAVISASGSTAVADNDLTLIAEQLPPASFGYFLVAPTEGFFPAAGGSQGNLCLSSPVGRLNRGPGEIFQATASGTAEVQLDLQSIPTPTGAIALAPGDTRHFQAWFRDANPGATSNFTNGLRIPFE